jgi:hypothetical protein
MSLNPSDTYPGKQETLLSNTQHTKYWIHLKESLGTLSKLFVHTLFCAVSFFRIVFACLQFILASCEHRGNDKICDGSRAETNGKNTCDESIELNSYGNHLLDRCIIYLQYGVYFSCTRWYGILFLKVSSTLFQFSSKFKVQRNSELCTFPCVTRN